MKSLVVFTIGLLLSNISFSQNYHEQFVNLSEARDTVGQKRLLIEWANKNSNDPELYTSYFNYYIVQSFHEVVRIDSAQRTGQAMQLTDDKNNVVGYMGSEMVYDPKVMELAFNWIDKGITKFPSRLDMRFGKIHMLSKTDDYDGFTNEIVKAIDYSPVNKNKWLWMMNEAVDGESQAFLLDNIQTYINSLFDLGPSQSKNIRKIAEATLKHYPNHEVSLSNLGVSYLMEDDFKKALEPLLKAEKKSPKDAIILSNIAYIYVNLPDNKKAIEYYEKVVKYGDAETKEYAEAQLTKLKK